MRGPPGEHVTNTQRLLQALYAQQIQPISASKISDPGDDCCVLVFSILIEIGLGNKINAVQHELVDNRLPETLYKLKDIFRSISATRYLEYAERFNNAQWKYRPMKFRYDMEKTFPEEYIIPICRKNEIGHGGQGRVYGIVVQEEYVCDRLHKCLPRDEHTRYFDPDYGQCFQLALKTYEDGKIASYEEEKRAFDGMKHTKGIIRYLGTYGHKEKRAVTNAHNESTTKTVITRHILLEYGQFDLMQIFECRLPPVFALEIKNFWTSLIEIVGALKGIHKLKTDNGEWSGWHNDIKPGNIIVVAGDYKLADPGFAKFKKKLETDPNPIPTIVAEGGTRTYAAPECYAMQEDSKVHVTQSVDIWSVGCVFSMAATWLVLGYQGVCQFYFIRRKAIEALARQAQNGTPRQQKIMQGDFFHNGRELLPEVKQWHSFLRKSIRKTDHITSALLDLVENELLVAAHSRIPAEALYAKLQLLIGETEVEETGSAMDTLMKTLVEIDETAPSMPLEWRKSSSKAQASHHMQHLNDPRLELRKTASRYEALSKLYGVKSTNAGSDVTVHQGPLYSRPYSYYVDQPHEEMNNHHGPSPTSVSPPPFGRSPTGRQRPTSKVTHQPQNVIQAREQLANTNWFKLKRGDPDLVLKAYFDNRDIKFLVDNASSMVPYWAEATFLLETLVQKATPFDDDGMDMYFTLGGDGVRRQKGSSAFRKAMGKARPSSTRIVSTDMTSALEKIFEAYFKDVQDQRRKRKPARENLTLIVLTDGVWDATEDKEEVGRYIVTGVLKRLEKLEIGGFKKRPVSIEFVQLGNDVDATARLQALDDDMPVKGYKDIIDHEMFSVEGDVRKMLLGSFVPWMDNTEPSPTRTNTMASLASVATGSRDSSYGAYGSAFSPPPPMEHHSLPLHSQSTQYQRESTHYPSQSTHYPSQSTQYPSQSTQYHNQSAQYHNLSTQYHNHPTPHHTPPREHRSQFPQNNNTTSLQSRGEQPSTPHSMPQQHSNPQIITQQPPHAPNTPQHPGNSQTRTPTDESLVSDYRTPTETSRYFWERTR
jgi:hypothetical protein